jgi:hypothetical protein
MTRAFIAAAGVALVIVAAVVVTVAVTPSAFGFGDASQAAPRANGRVIAVNVQVERKPQKPHQTAVSAPVRVAPAPVPPAPVASPPAPPVLAQVPPVKPTAVSGRRQQPGASKHPSAPAAVEARTPPPASTPQKTGKLDGTD